MEENIKCCRCKKEISKKEAFLMPEEKYGKDSVILYECGKFFEIFSIPENDLNIPVIGQIDRIVELLNIQKTMSNKKLPLSINNPNMC